MIGCTLGQQQNGLDPNFGHLLFKFMTSGETADISPSQFFSTFYSSLTRESSLVLISLPVMFLILTILTSLVSLPTLITMIATSFIQRRVDHVQHQEQVVELIKNTDYTNFEDPRLYF